MTTETTVRENLLALLSECPATVHELTDASGLPMASVRNVLDKMRRDGLIEGTVEGATRLKTWRLAGTPNTAITVQATPTPAPSPAALPDGTWLVSWCDGYQRCDTEAEARECAERMAVDYEQAVLSRITATCTVRHSMEWTA